MKKTTILLVALVAVLSARCSQDGPRPAADTAHQHEHAATEKGKARLSESASDFVGLALKDVQRRHTRSILQAMGKILAPQPRTAIVSYAFSGRVAKIHAEAGDWVELGQPLITLESHEVGEAESEFYKTTADLELARLTVDREKRLLDEGIGIRKNYTAAESAYKIAQTSAEAAEKKLHVLGFTEEQVQEIASVHRISPTITLDAPITGRVVTSEAVIGALVDESTEIMTIIDTTLLWVHADIYEKDIAKVKPGQIVEVVVLAYPREVFKGKVSYIGDVVDDETRTITVRAEVENPDARLKPGMFADVEILLNGNEQTLVVPVDAILEDGSAKVVFVKTGEDYQCREVRTGAVDNGYQQVFEGVREGEKVVVQGNYQLRSELLDKTLRAAHSH